METNEEVEETKTGFFTDKNGCLSMRRLLSFVLCLTSIAVTILNIWNETEWQMALVTDGIPLLGSLLFMFFTSWESIATVAKAVKNGN